MSKVNLETDFYDSAPLSTLDKRSSNIGVSVLAIFAIVLLLANFPRFIRGEVQPITFEYLLDVLSNAPEFNVSWVADFLSPITADWGAFNFLRNFINIFVDVSSAVLYLGTAVLHLVNFLLYFVRELCGF